jgi:hypothetical protein
VTGYGDAIQLRRNVTSKEVSSLSCAFQNAIAMLNNAGVPKNALPNAMAMTAVECRLSYCCRSSYYFIVASRRRHTCPVA